MRIGRTPWGGREGICPLARNAKGFVPFGRGTARNTSGVRLTVCCASAKTGWGSKKPPNEEHRRIFLKNCRNERVCSIRFFFKPLC